MAEEAQERSAGTAPDGDDRAAERKRRRADRERPVPSEPLPFSQLVGRIALVTIAVLFVIFALFNLQPVDFDWIVGETRVITRDGERVGGGVPLIALLLGSFALGVAVGAGLVWRRHRVRRARWERDRAEGGP